jgi:hypothetical protein
LDIADQINREDRSIKLLNFLLVGMRIIEVSISGFTPELYSDYDEKLVGKWYVDFEEKFLKSQ